MPGRPPLPGFAEEAKPADPRMQERDIRALLLYPENTYSPADLQRLEDSVRALVDAVASGSGLIRANEGRQAQPGTSAEKVIQQIRESLDGRNRVVFTGLAAWPSSAGNKPVACPPPNCGCGPGGNGIETCYCGLLRGEYCLCALCYTPPTKLDTIPVEEPVLTGIHIKGRFRNPQPGVERRPDGILVVLAAPPDAPPQVRQDLLNRALRNREVRSELAGSVNKGK